MPAAKLPIADFRTQSDWHAYLGKLTHAQLKKVAAALNRILRTEFRLNTKKPATELIEDVKKLYSVNNNTKLLEIVKGIDADQLPQPSQNLPKPTKKQVAAGKEVDKARVRKVIEERVSKAREDMKQAEIKKDFWFIKNNSIVISIIPTPARGGIQEKDRVLNLSLENPDINLRYTPPVYREGGYFPIGSFKAKELLSLKNKTEFINFLYNEAFLPEEAIKQKIINLDTQIKFFIDTNYGNQFDPGQSLLQGGSQSISNKGPSRYYLDAPPTNFSYGNPGVIYHHLTKIVKIK
jgi:hypothetical protein